MPHLGPEPIFIGIDIGTTSVKAVMGGVGGVRFDAFAAGHGMQHPSPGASEQDPDDWITQVEAALARFAGHPLASRVVAIGITSQVNTHVFCDAKGQPLHPAITWQDTRASAAAAALEAAIDPNVKSATLGAPIPIDSSHALARMAWMARADPEIWAQTAHVLLPKDFAILCLTGEVRSDPISAVGLVGPDLRYAARVLDLVPRATAVLPSLSDPLDIVGKVGAGHPFAGVPVATGTMDAWAGMFGLGVAKEGQAMYISGTSEVLGLISHRRSGTPGIITFPEWRGITLHAGPTQSGGASLAWLARLLSTDVADLDHLAASAPAGGTAPLFLPHLEGERAPLWDTTSRGAFAGLTGSDGPPQMTRAVMEGVAFSARLVVEALETSGQRSIANLLHGGGGASSDTWCQIRANALGRTVERVKSHEIGAMGALVLSGVASGHMAGLTEATRSLIATDRIFEPDPVSEARATRRFAAFKDLYSTLGPINRLLAGEA